MNGFALFVFICLWSWTGFVNTNIKHDKVIAAVVDNGCTIPNEILDPILDKIVKEQTE